jgi:hypothetical protein
MSDSNFFTSAASSPYLPIVASLVRGIVGLASSFGFTWALTVTGDQVTMIATAVLAAGMLGWGAWQKIAALRDSRRAEVAAAKASANATMQAGSATPVTVTITPAGIPNEAVRVPPAELVAAPSVPLGVAPSPAPRAA